MKLNPYLNYDGDAEAAFLFYKEVFGGELMMTKFTDMPGNENLPADEQHRVLHVSLPLSDGYVLMGSDILPSAGHVLQKGNNHYISLTPNSRDEADQLFHALAQGGKIEMPIEDMFWGDYFGSLIDKFGIRWMVSYTEPKKLVAGN